MLALKKLSKKNKIPLKSLYNWKMFHPLYNPKQPWFVFIAHLDLVGGFHWMPSHDFFCFNQFLLIPIFGLLSEFQGILSGCLYTLEDSD